MRNLNETDLSVLYWRLTVALDVTVASGRHAYRARLRAMRNRIALTDTFLESTIRTALAA